MTHQTRHVRVRLRTWTGHAEPDLAEWLGDAPHHFEGDQIVIHGEGADEDVRPRPGWQLVGWPDGVVTVASGRTAARLYEPAGLARSPEADVQHVIALYERWVKAGPPSIGTSMSRWWDTRLAELAAALNPSKEH